jgi:histidyl-tRNA synthetase
VKFEAPRGTQDVLESEQPKWWYVISQFEELCELYGYRRIETTVFEDTELFARTSGIGSDVVAKEMYTFQDRGGRSLTLRPEATAPIVRAYFNHGLHREPQPAKLYAIETIYRYGRPQKGRFREHRQLDLEAIGSDDPAVDAEVIQLYDTLLGRLGITEYQLELNSIGDRNCRPQYLEQQLLPWLAEHDSELDAETREQAARNPLRVLDNIWGRHPAVRDVLLQAPAIGDSLCEACKKHFEEVQHYLRAYRVEFKLVPTLVRGLDYYTRTTWEFVGPEGGSQSTLSGGGRYDGLAEELGAPPTPGVGFGAGIERLLIALGPRAQEHPEPEIDVFFVVTDQAVRPAVLAEMTKLRAAGRSCDTDYARRSHKGQLTQANRLGTRWWVDVGAAGALIRRRGEQEQTTWPPVEIESIADWILSHEVA